MRRLVTLLASLLVLAPACGQEPATGGGGEAQRFAADLRPLSGSDVEGTARMTLAGNHLIIDIDARGLEPRWIHPQHIRGAPEENGEPSCPASADDLDNGGYRLEEGERADGGNLLALEPFPTVGRKGRLDWNVTMNVDPDELRPLERRVVVLRGRMAGRDARGRAEYDPDIPVACGVIRPLESRASERRNG